MDLLWTGDVAQMVERFNLLAYYTIISAVYHLTFEIYGKKTSQANKKSAFYTRRCGRVVKATD